MKLLLRKAVPEDAPEIDALFREMLRSIYPGRSVSGYAPGQLDRFFSGGEDWICAAEAEGALVCFLSLEVHREARDYLYLDDCSVAEPFRGRGIGSRLLAEAESYARSLGLPLLVLHVEKSNARARRLYRRLGYLDAGERDSRFRMIKRL